MATATLAACGGPAPSVAAGGPTTTAATGVTVDPGPSDDGAGTSTVTAPAPAIGTTSIVTGGKALPPSNPAGPATTAPARANIYAGSGTPNPATAGARYLVYVPHEVGNITMVIDPTTFRVVDRFTTGAESQHVIPSWDMRTLYVAASRGDLLTPIDPTTGKAGPGIKVEDPYNLYFLPDGSEAIVVEEGNKTLTFTDPHTFAVHSRIPTTCAGINHLDFSADATFLVATCEFDGSLIKVDLVKRAVAGKIQIDTGPSGVASPKGRAQPQDLRLSADGTTFYVADLETEGVYLIDAATFRQTGYVRTGMGAHGLYPSRDGTKLYVVNRGTPIVGGPPRGKGSVAVLDMATNTVTATWDIPGGGSPDMGNLTPDGTQLWLGGRYDSEVYVFDTAAGKLLARIPVGSHPHGLTVWPQPGRFSLGHTGNMR